jgi:PncC family amidohydrolase
MLAVYNLHNKSIEVPVTDALEIEVGRLLQKRGLKLSLAESCTGGLISNRITDIPGSSEYFLGGIVSYAYEAKVDLLNVSWDTLKAYGAVSEQTVLEMARGVRKALNSDIAVSVSGIAGPGGATSDKPVGTTWVALVAADVEQARLFQFSGNRVENKASSAEAALQFLFDYLNGTLPKKTE